MGRGGRAGIYGRRESSEARLSAPCLMQRLLNPGGYNTATEIIINILISLETKICFLNRIVFCFVILYFRYSEIFSYIFLYIILIIYIFCITTNSLSVAISILIILILK